METTIKILYAEDDANLAMVTQDHLQMLGYDVKLATDGLECIDMFEKDTFNIAILDVLMPGKDGFEVAEYIRKTNEQIPIIFLTAKSLKEDKIRGFTVGADDYMLKPYSIEELSFKIKIFLKRANQSQTPAKPSNHIAIGEYTYRVDDQSLVINEVEQSLSFKEAEILKLLSQNIGTVVKREDILMAAWGNDDYYSGRSLDVYMSRLRKMLSQDKRIDIINQFAVGFKLVVKG
jgi:two-component system, OmpR family, response regulator VicR